MRLAELRVLRLALGTAISLAVSLTAAWPLSFIAPALVTVLLSLPMPVPPVAMAVKLTVVILVALAGGLLLLPTYLLYPLVGILLLGLALYRVFYFTASGGSAVLGTLATAGIAIATAVGTVSIDAALQIVNSLVLSSISAFLSIWVAFWLLPDRLAAPDPAPPAAPPPAAAPGRSAARNAFRAMLIVFPVGLWMLMSPASASYVPVMIKVAAMGQQVNAAGTRQVALSLIQSTLIGGTAAIVGWGILQWYPSALLYVLLVGLAGLVIGRGVFLGRRGPQSAETWSYGYLTMLVILAPAVLDSAAGTAAGVRFADRLLLFVGATAYAVAAVFVADALFPANAATPERPSESAEA